MIGAPLTQGGGGQKNFQCDFVELFYPTTTWQGSDRALMYVVELQRLISPRPGLKNPSSGRSVYHLHPAVRFEEHASCFLG